MNSSPEHFQNLSQTLANFWRWLIEPSIVIPDASSRYRARMVMLIALLVTPSIFIISFLVSKVSSSDALFVGNPSWQMLAFMLAYLVVLYGLSRKGYHQIAIHLGIHFASGLVVLGAIPPHYPPNLSILSYFSLIILFSNIFLSIRSAFRVALVQTLMTLSLPLLVSEIAFNETLGVIAFIWITFGIITLLARYRNQLEITRSQELIENEEKYRLLFDSSIHAVLIHDGNRVILSNNAAARIAGYERGEQVMGTTLSHFIHPEDFAMVAERAKSRLGGDLSVPERYEMRILSKDGVTRWVDAHSSLIMFGGQRMTMASAIEITERKRVEETLRFRLALDKIITSISTKFINLQPEATDNGITEALTTIGKFVKADHSYVCLYTSDQTKVNNTHEWCAVGVASHKSHLNNITTNRFSWSAQQILRKENVYCPTLQDIPDPKEQYELAQLGIKSFVEVPMVYQDKVLGLVGIDSTRMAKEWTEETISLLRIAGEIFATALERQRNAIEIKQRTQVLETLNELATITASTLELEPLLGNVARLLCEALDGTSAYVTDWNLEANSSTVLAEYFSPNASQRERISDLGVSYPIYDGQEEYAKFDLSRWVLHFDDTWIPPLAAEHMREFDAKTILHIPLIAESEPIGQLELWESRQKRDFSKGEIELMHAIASQTAIALQKAYLYTALHDSEERNKIVLDALPDMILRLDRSGRYLDIKSSDLSRINIHSETALGKTPYETMPAELANRLMVVAEDAFTERRMQVFEYGLNAEDGVMHSYECRVVHISAGEILAFVRDITELKQAQGRQLELAVERERVKILEQFISDASHDLRTPIANLKSRVYLLRKVQTPQDQERQVNVIEAEISRLERLIEDLLTMSQLDSNFLLLSFQQVALNRLINEQLEIHSPAIEAKNLSMEFEPATNLPTVLGNRTEISRLLNNLISNAINYTPQGGISLKTYHKNEGVIVEVSDTGIGIRPEELPKIFERFYRSDKARSTDKGGTGLGLAICKKITELHNGTLEVESEPDKGSTFRVWLPLNLVTVALNRESN